jgi:hypothetical protein
MAEVGDVIIRPVLVSAKTFFTISAPAGETQKISMIYAKGTNAGEPRNTDIHIAPASGDETGTTQGAVSSNKDVGVVGGNPDSSAAEYDGLQPIFIDEATELYIGNNNSNQTIRVIVQAIRTS